MKIRPRRLRKNPVMRELMAETTLKSSHLIQPYFVIPGENKEEIPELLNGMGRFTVDRLLIQLEKDWDLGIRQILLFGVPLKKDALGSEADDASTPLVRAVSAVKERFAELFVITDVCLCPYTDHGHCGLVEKGPTGMSVQNDATLERLASMALVHARAGADCVSPSDMMDGRVGRIRDVLDENSFEQTLILSYTVKYASSFYGPFRDVAQSSPQEGDRSTYQMDPRNVEEGLRELELDLQEGADLVMVKPAAPFLDVIHRVKQQSSVPVLAYHVSGEYASWKLLVQEGMADPQRMILEVLLGIRRAGASAIITYATREILEKNWLE